MPVAHDLGALPCKRPACRLTIGPVQCIVKTYAAHYTSFRRSVRFSLSRRGWNLCAPRRGIGPIGGWYRTEPLSSYAVAVIKPLRCHVLRVPTEIFSSLAISRWSRKPAARRRSKRVPGRLVATHFIDDV